MNKLSKKFILLRFIDLPEKVGYIGGALPLMEYLPNVSGARRQLVKSWSKLIFGSVWAEIISEMVDLRFQIALNRWELIKGIQVNDFRSSKQQMEHFGKEVERSVKHIPHPSRGTHQADSGPSWDAFDSGLVAFV